MRNSILTIAFAFAIVAVSPESFAARSWSKTLTYKGVAYMLSSSSTCADGKAALRYNRKWWCPVTTATASSGTTTTTTTTPTTTITAPTTYRAQLSWTAPATRADGTALTLSELAGYEIYYTTDDPAVAGTINISGNTTVSYTLSSLKAGNYYFAMAAIDTKGQKSVLSAVAPIKLGS